MTEIQQIDENTALIGSNTTTACDRQKTWPIVCIVATLMLERAAYYSILANLLIFVGDELDLGKEFTVMCVFLFTGVAWLMSTVGGIIGDSYVGRFNVIWGSLLIYIAGAVLLELTAYMHHIEFKKKKIMIGFTLFILSVGEGAFKANISAFGAEQLVKQDEKTYRTFFGWFYWSINIGCFVGFSVVAWVQQEFGFKIGFYPPLGCLVLAFIIFLIPRTKYTVYPLSANVFKKVYGIVREAYSRRKRTSARDSFSSVEEVMPIQSCLDRAMMKYGGSFLDSEVSEIKTLGKISVMFVVLIPYWMIYFQMNSTFLLQGVHMNLRLGTPRSNKSCVDDPTYLSNNVPAACLSIADVALLILAIPLMDKLIYPWLDRKGWDMTLLKRISIGFLFAIGAMVAAGVVEYKRNESLNKNEASTQCINKKLYNASDMSIFYQIPQYGLIGISEVFSSVGSLEFAYREAPPSMHGFVMGLFYLVQSLASIAGAGLYAFSSEVLDWIKTGITGADLGDHLDYYFYLLGGILFVTWLVFVVLSVRYDVKYCDKDTIRRMRPRLSRGESQNANAARSSSQSVVT